MTVSFIFFFSLDVICIVIYFTYDFKRNFFSFSTVSYNRVNTIKLLLLMCALKSEKVL